MARRSQCSSAGDNPLDPNYLPPHYREEYRLAVDALVEDSLEGYYQCLQNVDVVNFLSPTEIRYIQSMVQPPKQSIFSEQQFLDSEGEGSSDTYWPIHSDLDVPGLDLGWPQVHHFIEPTEVTTLVNPPEPDMPSIKEQARRLIKNAQQVIAIVMDMFTDVDIFADILNAAGRRVPVYILLDEQNADLFVNMVANCRVNLLAFPFIRVRTVSGITYQCRSGKSFKGQMMDRFLLTDCRAVLSGNYSFMWSFEKLHRCMAHLFLGQLVTTFDEEFRILFAQSQPLNVENMLAQMEDLNVLQKRQFPNESTSVYREPKRVLSLEIPSDDWGGHPYDDQMDGNLRIMALKRQGSLRGPAEMYNRFSSQQPRMDPGFDQGPSRLLMTDNPVLKRHSYTEDVPSRYPHPVMPQHGMLDSEPRGKLFHRGQQPFPGPGPEEEYSSYDKFWNQGYLPEQYPVPGFQQEVPPPEFDPVLNYFSSTRNLEFDQGSDKLQPPVDFPFPTHHPKRLGVGQPYICQTSPTPSNSADQKPFFHDLTVNRKDPSVKQKLRNWRIGSYLNTYDNPEEEGLPVVPTQVADPFEEHLNPIQQTAPVPDLPLSKIPNVKEFKVTTIPRVSQMPSYAKAAIQEKPKKVLDELVPVAAETKTTPTSAETSSTAEEIKTEEEDQKQPKNTVLLRDESFRRKYNAAGLRTSRLRSSLIFSSLDQQIPQETTTADQDDEGGDKTKTEQTKPPLVSQVLGQRRSTAREPFEWSRYIKSSSETLKPDDVSKKDEDKDSSRGKDSQDLTDTPEAKEATKLTDVGQDSVSQSMPRAKLPEAKASKTDQLVQPTEPLLNYVDMNDPDKRLMFFKELAAQRKAAKAAEAQKVKKKAELKPQSELKNSSACQKEEPLPKGTPETSVAKDLVKKDSVESKNTSNMDSNTCKTSNEQKTQPKKTELDGQSVAGLSVSTETPLEDPSSSNPFVKESLSALMPQSKPTTDELPKTDQPIPLPNPLLTAPYVDMSDPDNRLMFFKELAAKRKASETKKAEEEAPMKPQADLQNTSHKEEDPPKATAESVEPSTMKGSSVKNTTVSTETSDSESSPSLKRDENARKQDSLVKNDSGTLSTCGEQSHKVSAESVKTDLERQSAEESGTSQSKSLDNTTVSKPVENNSPKQANAAHTAILSHGEGADKEESATLESLSVIPSSAESSSSSDPQNIELVQQETKICSPPLPSEAETKSEVGSFEPLVQISTSDTPPLDLGLQNHPATAEETSFSDSAQKVYSFTNDISMPSLNIDEIKAQESVSPSQQESLNELLPNSDSQHDQTHLDAVSQSASVANAANVETDVSPDKKVADLEPDKLNATTETSREESSAGTPSVGELEKNVPELGQEESVAKEHDALKSPEDAKADSTSPAVCPSVPDFSLLSEPGPEGSVSEPNLEKTVSSVTAPGDTQPEAVPSETGSLENTECCNASLLEKTEPPQDTAMLTAPSSELKLTDLNAPSAAETSPSSTSESVQSVLDPETKESVTSVSTVPNLSDTNSISSETPPKSEESLVQPTTQSLSSPSDPTTAAPAEADLPCKTSEAVTPESQTPEPPAPQESCKKEAELVETDEKKSNNLEDKDKSQKPSTEESASREKTKDQSKQGNCSETTEVTSKQPKSSQSRYHSSTVNVITSSNLRDDTKLLLEQISAQSQSRNEATKESPVTDDEKEDKADKNAKNGKEFGYRTFNRGQTKSTQEKEKLLERIQSMRKERKVYSRFEMAP
ncbi:uncharacterized protein fam83ha [Anableps anableps]